MFKNSLEPYSFTLITFTFTQAHFPYFHLYFSLFVCIQIGSIFIHTLFLLSMRKFSNDVGKDSMSFLSATIYPKTIKHTTHRQRRYKNGSETFFHSKAVANTSQSQQKFQFPFPFFISILYMKFKSFSLYNIYTNLIRILLFSATFIYFFKNARLQFNRYGMN